MTTAKNMDTTYSLLKYGKNPNALKYEEIVRNTYFKCMIHYDASHKCAFEKFERDNKDMLSLNMTDW